MLSNTWLPRANFAIMASPNRSSIEMTIDEVSKQYREKLQRFTLKNVKSSAQESTKTNDENRARNGAYGKVIDLDNDGTPCVGKILHSSFFDVGTDVSGIEGTLHKFYNEIETLSTMKHSNIVPFIGMFYQQGSSLPVLVMEKMECNLTEYLKNHTRGSITEDMAMKVLLDVSKGLFYLHEIIKVAHRDLSSNNILLAADLSAKIADLGSARVLDRPGGWDPCTKLTVQPGTLDFMPPETLKCPPEYIVSVDVFSFGCVIIHLDTHVWPSPIPVPKGQFISEIERRNKYISEMGS